MAVETVRLDASARVLARVRAVPIWLWLTSLVVVSAGVRYVLSRHAGAPWIMEDELIYSELAKSFAATGHFLVRDHATAAYGVVYPLLIAPAWAIFHAVPAAYAAAKAINSVVMSLAALPAYFIARRVLGQWQSLLIALMTLALPSLVFTGTLMTENAFFPVFLCTALALFRWLEQPTRLRLAVLIVLCGVAYLTRQQAIAFVPAMLTAPLLVSGRRGLREYRLAYGAFGALAILFLAIQEGRGAPLGNALGAYKVTSQVGYSATAVVKWLLWHVAELDLSLGILPFAALIILAVQIRGLPPRARIFTAGTLAITFWLVLEVSTFASRITLRIEERDLFYLQPLFLIALLVWIDRGLPRPAKSTAAAVLVAVALPGILPYAHLIDLSALSDTFAILPIWGLEPHPFGIEQIPGVVVLASLVAGLVFLFVPRRFALVLPALLLVYFAVSQKPIEGKIWPRSDGSIFVAGLSPSTLDWIDKAVGSNADVVGIWTGASDKFSIWEDEIFNRSLGTIYRTGDPLPGGLTEEPIAADKRTGLLADAQGRVVRAHYALADASLALAGTVVAHDYAKEMLLYRVDGPLRQLWRVNGLWPDTWSGPEVSYTRLGCNGGTVSATVESDPNLLAGPQTVTVLVGGREVSRVVVPPGQIRSVPAPLRPSGGTCVVKYLVSPTEIPVVVTKGQLTDTRNLGLHFNAFAYHP